MAGLDEHGVGQVNADDPALGTDLPLDQWEVQARAAGDLDHGVSRAKPEGVYRPAAVGPLAEVELGRDVVAPRLPPVRRDEVLSGTFDLPHYVHAIGGA